MIRAISAFPTEFVDRINDSNGPLDFERIVGISMEGIENILDEQALHSIRTLIMVEYARCCQLPGDVVVKSFDGKNFNTAQPTNASVTKALKSIKERNGRND